MTSRAYPLGLQLRFQVLKVISAARSVHTGAQELLTAHAHSRWPVHLLGNSTVELTSGLDRLGPVKFPWQDVVTAWEKYRTISSLQNEELYGTVQDKLFSLTSTSDALDCQEAVLSYLMANLRMCEVLPLYQFAEEYMVTAGLLHSPALVSTPLSKPHPDFSVHAWGHASEVFISPRQHVTVHTKTWLRRGVESIHVPWWMMQRCMEVVAQYSDAEFQEEYMYSDEDLSVVTHYYENGIKTRWHKRQGTELMCKRSAIICRLDSWPLRVDIPGMPHLLHFRNL